jgi:hypothetical protein
MTFYSFNLSAAKITAGCALPRRCALASAQLGWETQPVRSVGLQSLQSRKHVKEDMVYLLTFPNISNARIKVTIFYLTVFKAIFVNVLILVVAVLR